MSDDEMVEAEGVNMPIRHGMINTDDLVQQDEVPNIEQQAAETLSLPEASREAQEKQEELMRKLELKRRLRSAVVPTDPGEVKALLRQLAEPITLFGEREGERRDRLRKLVASMDPAEQEALQQGRLPLELDDAGPALRREKFYTEGSPALQEARRTLAHKSLQRAADRLAGAKRRRESPDEDERAEAAAMVDSLAQISNQSSEFADERPISACRFSPDGSLLASTSWSGHLKLWSMPACQHQQTIRAHQDRSLSGSELPALATGASDRCARVWSSTGKLLHDLRGHEERLGRIAFHPLGLHLGTASFDQTWRLWDLATGQCILEQEGHSRAVYALAFQQDGALAATGGLDAIGRVWDLRSGRSIMALEGHVKDILSMDWSPNGYLLASGSNDNTCRIWDMRKRDCTYTLPAHTSLVSQVRFEPSDGHFLVTAGYDNLTKLWDSRGLRLVKTLAGHEGKVMGADVSADSRTIVTAGYDRTIKLWHADDLT
ncbi:hypothetical protein WJX84_004246 [Apatococcus fuscideae]|uniref:Pre-mRNA processing factor 4 (PRP4)-like domain-containing protein n=1 Tax=Apatococcus fuscideae TaxID=2026836 RepID=A0AAW1SJ86_9CHLO